ncbi:MAG TPA: YoaK family protein [Streptosporangiaceae bacterium]|nr:YoaK family protein [Streptosporangiaceae bacterium]
MTGDDTGSGTRPLAGRRLRDGLVVLLAVGSGAADVTAFLVLGKVFSSVITGNLVLLGLAAATAQPGLALRSGLALGGYSAGVLIGAPIAARGRHQIWPPAVTAALSAELCLLLGFAAAWEAGRQRPGWQLAMLVLLAAALGVQSAAVNRLGDMSATYLTGTLTGALTALVTRNRRVSLWRDVSVLGAIVAGASAGAALIRLAPAWLPALTLLPLLAVIATASRFRWAASPAN